jgi:hypothetical protein
MAPAKRRAVERAARGDEAWWDVALPVARALREQARLRRTLDARRRAACGGLWHRLGPRTLRRRERRHRGRVDRNARLLPRRVPATRVTLCRSYPVNVTQEDLREVDPDYSGRLRTHRPLAFGVRPPALHSAF